MKADQIVKPESIQPLSRSCSEGEVFTQLDLWKTGLLRRRKEALRQPNDLKSTLQMKLPAEPQKACFRSSLLTLMRIFREIVKPAENQQDVLSPAFPEPVDSSTINLRESFAEILKKLLKPERPEDVAVDARNADQLLFGERPQSHLPRLGAVSQERVSAMAKSIKNSSTSQLVLLALAAVTIVGLYKLVTFDITLRVFASGTIIICLLAASLSTSAASRLGLKTGDFTYAAVIVGLYLSSRTLHADTEG